MAAIDTIAAWWVSIVALLALYTFAVMLTKKEFWLIVWQACWIVWMLLILGCFEINEMVDRWRAR